MPQPHLIFDDSKMWKLDHVRGHTLGSPLINFRQTVAGKARGGRRGVPQGLHHHADPLSWATKLGPLSWATKLGH